MYWRKNWATNCCKGTPKAFSFCSGRGDGATSITLFSCGKRPYAPAKKPFTAKYTTKGPVRKRKTEPKRLISARIPTWSNSATFFLQEEKRFNLQDPRSMTQLSSFPREAVPFHSKTRQTLLLLPPDRKGHLVIANPGGQFISAPFYLQRTGIPSFTKSRPQHLSTPLMLKGGKDSCHVSHTPPVVHSPSCFLPKKAL